MRNHFLLVFTFIVISNFSLFAVLPDGSPAPDWTLTDLNGNTHNLHTYLNQGKAVILDFSATWCPPCWSFHNSGRLGYIYNTYGPNGTDDVMVFMIEGDGSINEACLYGPSGCSGGTQGDWVSNTDYPIINLVEADISVASDYNITFWPTIYVISPVTKEVYETGATSIPGFVSWIFDSFSLNASENTTDILYVAPLNVVTQYLHPLCSYSSDGQIDLAIDGGLPDYHFSWTGPNGFTSNDISLIDLSPGIYEVVVSDQNGNQFTEVYTLIAPDEINIVGVVQNLFCFGESDGSIEVMVDGGTGILEMTWEDSASGSSRDDLPAGMYDLLISDENGCIHSVSYEITTPDEIVAFDLSVVNETNADASGSIEISISGGVEPYEFLWTNGETTEDISNLSSREYSCEVTEGNSCQRIFGPFAVDNVTSTYFLEGMSQFDLLPNPAVDHLSIAIQGEKKIHRMSTLTVEGKQILSKDITNG